ncbi:unknown protein [Seminavis robusta]|uniref:Uncharacterized protein n=1 Tax=Seminavis robusta TaxID=568900 RepID=A0A9N8DYD6_9STRA|nr:unknown protein [Seminavis robusta]|eukprot:Sro465_g148670.1 n/a (148) ;mRNA; f:57796-58239
MIRLQQHSLPTWAQRPGAYSGAPGADYEHVAAVSYGNLGSSQLEHGFSMHTTRDPPEQPPRARGDIESADQMPQRKGSGGKFLGWNKKATVAAAVLLAIIPVAIIISVSVSLATGGSDNWQETGFLDPATSVDAGTSNGYNETVEDH